MKDFFKSKRFHLLLAVFSLLFAFLLRAIYTDALMPFLSGVGGIIMTPVARVTASLSGLAGDALGPYLNVAQLVEENEALREENRRLTEQMVDYQNLKTENDQFREYLELKERNQDFVFEPASVIGRSPDDRFGSFIIDVGTYHGITERCPVITSDGLVGVVQGVSYGYAKVTTILDVSIDVGGVDIRSLDTGVITGTFPLAEQDRCKLGFLSRESGVTVGDTIVTSGVGGMMPRGLVIGEVESVENEVSGLSLYAVIKPAADIRETKSVVVIKDFAGKDENAGFTE
ncbi:rod shape-determining protein MreC [Angelakisella massiliensis]|uniref:rod shape-determining protein MreC n=1 Tax=Angelakisella massiliensis TaxID=1871018 RepID=UPI0008F80775|nr:rod shape-determining protein MreC [Angelakisella massiliensis]